MKITVVKDGEIAIDISEYMQELDKRISIIEKDNSNIIALVNHINGRVDFLEKSQNDHFKEIEEKLENTCNYIGPNCLGECCGKNEVYKVDDKKTPKLEICKCGTCSNCLSCDSFTNEQKSFILYQIRAWESRIKEIEFIDPVFGFKDGIEELKTMIIGSWDL